MTTAANVPETDCNGSMSGSPAQAKQVPLWEIVIGIVARRLPPSGEIETEWWRPLS